MLPEIVCRLKDFEARIARVIGMFDADFGGGFFYAGFGDVEDGRVACFTGFGFSAVFREAVHRYSGGYRFVLRR